MKKNRILAICILLCMTTMNALAQYDWTSTIKNASFETGSSGWSLSNTVSGWEDIAVKEIAGAPDGSKAYNIWAQNVSSIDLSQQVLLPAGQYALTAHLYTNEAGLANQHLYAVTSAGATTSGNLSQANSWQQLRLSFTLNDEGYVTLGAASTGTGSGEKGWFQIDNFQLSGTAQPGNNTNRTVEQVAQAISLSGAAELHITSAKPFTATGSVDIAENGHAVVFLDSLRPSQAKAFLGFITISGKPAVAESNCQLRLYDHGTLIYPYGREDKADGYFHPLTVYDKQNCQGKSFHRFGIENTNGYMNTLTDSTFNNRIRSFILRRGYMVTFSVAVDGYGYQRCFIADDKDLVVNTLPDILDKRISSYRVFRWNNLGKNGVANILNTTNLKKLNCTWTYAWGPGNELGSDYECVPHMNNLWSSTTYQLGANNQSPNMKTDNEPANGNDPKPATVSQELERWQDLMRTGRRLLSPSSFDSGEWWHKQFFDSIDARGWRCDVVDIHSYWSEGSFNNIKSNWVNKYHRPIWITEFIWGASWSGGFGIFGIAKTNEQRGNPNDTILQKNREVLSRIWTKLNGMDYVERYAYWNDEWPCSKILWNDKLTPAGEYYSKMKTGVGYSGNYNYVPTNWRCIAVTDVAAALNAKTKEVKITWTAHNGDLTETMALQRRKNAGEWETITTWTRPDSVEMSYTDLLDDEGSFSYRIVETTWQKAKLTSPSVAINQTFAHGEGDIRYGTYVSQNTEKSTINFNNYDGKPIVLFGAPSFNNSSVGVVPYLSAMSKRLFRCNFQTWQPYSALTLQNPESVDWIALKPGTYNWGGVEAQVDTCTYTKANGSTSRYSRGDTIEVMFRHPFAVGVQPVVIVRPFSSVEGSPVVAKVFDISNVGFKMKLMKPAGDTRTLMSQPSYYLAATPGRGEISDINKVVYVGRFDNPVGGASLAKCSFALTDGTALQLSNPTIVMDFQTHELDVCSQLRWQSYITTTTADGKEAITGIKLRRLMDTTLSSSEIGYNSSTANGDQVGWLILDDPGTTGIGTVSANSQKGSSTNAIYDIAGRPVSGNKGHLQKGMYIQNGRKIIVK